jgi:hypothetical protein
MTAKWRKLRIGIRKYEHNLQSLWIGDCRGTAILQFLRRATKPAGKSCGEILCELRQPDFRRCRILQ